jgi:hypothetical protein
MFSVLRFFCHSGCSELQSTLPSVELKLLYKQDFEYHGDIDFTIGALLYLSSKMVRVSSLSGENYKTASLVIGYSENALVLVIHGD